MTLQDLQMLANYALRVYRVVAKLPANQQAEVMAIVHAAVNVSLQRALRPQEPEDE